MERRDSAERVRELFDQAGALSGSERVAFLDEACGGDARLRAEVEELLRMGEATGGFLEGGRLPERFGPFLVEERLGRGGMGIVFRARREGTEQRVALKTVRSGDALLLASIRREIEALAELRHPGIVRILDVGVQDGLPWYAMELHEGSTLGHHARAAWGRGRARDDGVHWWTTTLLGSGAERQHGRTAPLLPSAAGGQLAPLLTLVHRLCPPLAYLHGEGIIHRDLKPANVLVLPSGRPLLIDFGLTAPLSGGRAREALDTHTGALGTVAYMAPEQAAGELLDARTDLYALGCILYELLTGDVPLAAPTALEMIERRRREDPPAPSRIVGGVPPVLDELVLGLLARDRRARIGHADAVAEALAAAGAIVEPGDAGAPRPKPYLYRPGLSGREAALAELSRHLSRTPGARGRLLLLSGESGVGKTRLATTFAARAHARGWLVLTGECQAPLRAGEGGGGAFHPLARTFDAVVDRCRQRGGAVAARVVGSRASVLAPFGPFASLAPAPLAPVVELPPAAARQRLLDAAAETLAALAREEQLCLILDDLQWADELTLDLLLLLGRGERLRQVPLLVLGTYRTDEASPGLEALERAASRPAVHLDRLGAPEVARIVSEMLALPGPPQELCALVARVSEGNPFFVAEYLRAAVAAGIVIRDGHGRWLPGQAGGHGWQGLKAPGSIEAIVRGRLERLPAEARELVAAASVLGRTFETDISLEASGLGETSARRSLGTLLACEVLELVEGRLRFVHHKLWETALEDQPPDRRRDRHRAAAVAIEARHGAGDPRHQAALGLHWSGAGEPARARPCYLAAAREAAGRYAGAEASRLYRDYLALAPDPTAERTDALLELGQLLHMLGERVEPLQLARRARADATALELRAARTKSVHVIGNLLHRMGELPDARAAYESALTGYGDLGDPTGESLAILDLARVHHQAGRMEEARSLYEDSLERSRRRDDRAAIARAASALAGLHHDQGRDQQSRALYEEALGILRANGDRPRTAAALANIANLDSSRGREGGAEASYQEALAIALATGDRGLESQVLGNLAVLHTRAGRPARAEELYRKSLGIAREIGDRYAEGFVLIYLGEIVRGAGRNAEARTLFTEALAVHRATQDPRGEATAMGSLALLELTEGNLERARDVYERALALFRDLGDRRSEGLTLMNLARLSRRSDDLPRARDEAESAGALLDVATDPVEAARCLVEQAHVALAQGGSARELLGRARALAADAGVELDNELHAQIARLEAAVVARAAGIPLQHGELAPFG